MLGKAAKAAGRSVKRDIKKAVTPKVVESTSKALKNRANANARRKSGTW